MARRPGYALLFSSMMMMTGCAAPWWAVARAEEPRSLPSFVTGEAAQFRITAAKTLARLVPYQPTPPTTPPAASTPPGTQGLTPPVVEQAPLAQVPAAPATASPQPLTTEPQAATNEPAQKDGPTAEASTVPAPLAGAAIEEADAPTPARTIEPPVTTAACKDGTERRDWLVVAGRRLSEQLTIMTYEAGFDSFIKDTGKTDWPITGNYSLDGCLSEAIDELLSAWDGHDIRPVADINVPTRKVTLRRYP